MSAVVATDDLDLAFAEASNVRPRQRKKDSVDGTAAADGPPVGFTVDVAKLGPVWLPNGYYTLTFPCGSHRTLRVFTQQKGTFAGKRIVALLIGPDNTADYESAGFVFPNGMVMWKRFRNTKTAEYAQLLWDLKKGEKIDGYDVLVSIRCRVCNRPLTDAMSIKAEVGPLCRERTGFTGWSPS